MGVIEKKMNRERGHQSRFQHWSSQDGEVFSLFPDVLKCQCLEVPQAFFFMTASFVGFAISEFTVNKFAVHKFTINSSTVKIPQTTSLEKRSFEQNDAVLSP